MYGTQRVNDSRTEMMRMWLCRRSVVMVIDGHWSGGGIRG